MRSNTFKTEIEKYNDTWNIIEKLKWNEDNNIERIKNTILNSFEKNEIINLNKELDGIFRIVHEWLEDHYDEYKLGLGDDGLCDLTYHIIGSGKSAVLEMENNPKNVMSIAHNHTYVESFSYAFLYEEELEESYTLEQSENYTKSIVSEALVDYKNKINILKESIVVNDAYIEQIEEVANPIVKMAQDFLDGVYNFDKFNHDEVYKNIKELDKKTKPVSTVISMGLGHSNNEFNDISNMLFTYSIPNMIQDYKKALERVDKKDIEKIELTQKERKHLKRKSP